MLNRTINPAPNMAGINTVTSRHKEGDGFCLCCCEPWPCDVRIIDGMLFGREW